MDDLEKLAGQLQEIGFSQKEAVYYKKLYTAGESSVPQRLKILCEKRRAA